MMSATDVDTIPPQDMEQYKTPESQVVIEQTVDDYQQRYMDILQDGSGDTIQLQEMSYEQTQDMMNEGEDVLESEKEEALNNFAGFLDDLKKKKYSQEEAGKILQNIVNNVQKVDVIQNGEKSYREIYQDILSAYELYQESSEAQDIFISIVKDDPRLFSFAPDGDDGLIPFTVESLKSLAETVSPKKMELYLFFDTQHTEDEKKMVIEFVQQEIGDIAPLLEQTSVPRFDRLKTDPSMLLFEKIHEVGLSGVGFENEIQSDRGKTQLELMVARNMYQEGITSENITQEDIQNAEQEILDMRNSYKNIELFAGRGVEIFADYEINSNGEFVFGKDGLVQKIESQGASVSRYRPLDDSRDSAQELKSDILTSLGSPDSSAKTFVFDMHGEEGGGGVLLKKGVSISAQELFDAYIQRWEGGAPSGQKDIFILNACFSHRMIMEDFYPLIEEYNRSQKAQIPTPIFIFGSEYFQYGVVDVDSPYGSNLYEHTLDLKGDGKTKIKNIIENESSQKETNPSLYVPNEKNIPVQIAGIDDSGVSKEIV